MNTLYWITRLDSILRFFLAISLIAGFIVVGLFIAYAITSSDRDFMDNCANNTHKKAIFKNIYTYLTIFVISILFRIFIPSSKDAYIIYGVGGTVDYLKSNPTAKQLPDKCIKALDCYLDKEIIQNQKDSIK